MPNTPYGKSKLMSEENYFKWFQKDKKNKILTICRSGVVFGPGEKGNVTRLIKAIRKGYFFYMGNKNLKKGGIYIKELIHTIYWINENQINKVFENYEIYNASFYPCPSISDYVKSINSVLKFDKNYLSISKNIIKFFIELTSFLTKRLNAKSNYHYTRLNKLFVDNNIEPKTLLNKNYKFLYNLNAAFIDWKKTNPSDWT